MPSLRNVLATLCLGLLATGAFAETGEDTELKPIIEQTEFLKAQLDLEKAKAALELDALQQQVDLLTKQQSILNSSFPQGTATPLDDFGISAEGFTMPIRLQAVRACKRLANSIGEKLGSPRPLPKPTGNVNQPEAEPGKKVADAGILVLTDVSLLPKIRKYRQALAALKELNKRLMWANKLPLTAKEWENTKESATLAAPTVGFTALRSILSNSADIAAFFKTSTQIGGEDFDLSKEVLATQLSAKCKKSGWQTQIAQLHFGSGAPSELRVEFDKVSAQAALLKAEIDKHKKKESSVVASPALAVQPKKVISKGFDASGGSHGKESGATGAAADPPPATSATQPQVVAGALAEKEAAYAEFDSLQRKLLAKESDKEPYDFLTTLDGVADLVSLLDRRDCYLLMADYAACSGGRRILKGLFNSGTISFTAGVAVWYSFVTPDNIVEASDAVYDYAGWQRMKDEGPDIPLRSSEDDQRYVPNPIEVQP